MEIDNYVDRQIKMKGMLSVTFTTQFINSRAYFGNGLKEKDADICRRRCLPGGRHH